MVTKRVVFENALEREVLAASCIILCLKLCFLHISCEDIFAQSRIHNSANNTRPACWGNPTWRVYMAYVHKNVALLLGSPYLFDRVTLPLG